MSNADTFTFGAEGQPRFLASHAIAPILIGLMAPALALFVIDPRALNSASVLVHVYLGALFVIATGAYIVTVFDSGEVTRVAFARDRRVIEVERTGLLARKTTEIPFSDVATLRIETRYDDDGYRSDVPLLVLTTHEVLELPATTSAADIATMRGLLGRT